MYVSVYRLYVIEKCVGIRHYAVYSLARDKTAGVNRGIYSAAFHFLQNLAASLALQQTLAAGKSDSAAALVIKAPILNECGAYLVNGHLRAEYFNRALRTDLGAPSAKDAFFLVYRMNTAGKTVEAANLRAFSAHNALVFVKGKLPLWRKRFGIVTPQTLERAAFKKYGSPYSVAVMHGKSFYFDYVYIHYPPLLSYILGSCNVCVLLLFAEVIPQHIPAAYANLKVLVFFGVFLRVAERFRVEYVKLHRLTAVFHIHE